jgi:hypothetical protein
MENKNLMEISKTDSDVINFKTSNSNNDLSDREVITILDLLEDGGGCWMEVD